MSMSKPMLRRPTEPWDSFLKELDSAMDEAVRLDCIGGFVISQLYGLDRATADLDVVELVPGRSARLLTDLGCRGSVLHRRYRVYLDRVGVAALPESYEDRLSEMFPGTFQYLRLMAVDPYDLALSKLERNSQKDRDDVRFLARRIPLDLKLLRDRYATEIRWQLGQPEREDLTLQLWIDAIEEDRATLPSIDL